MVPNPRSAGVPGGRHHLWLQGPPELRQGLPVEQLPAHQRDHQHLDSLPAHMVCSCSRTNLFGAIISMSTTH